MTNEHAAHDVRLATESQRQAVVIDDGLVGQVASTLEKAGVRFQDVVDEARLADKVQHVDLGVIKALRLHWKAALWSVGISTCLVMEGYDLVIITSLYVFSFCRPSNKLTTLPFLPALAKTISSNALAPSYPAAQRKRRLPHHGRAAFRIRHCAVRSLVWQSTVLSRNGLATAVRSWPH